MKLCRCKFIYMYLLGKYLLPPLWGWHTSSPKETRRKGGRIVKKRNRIEAQRAKPPTQTWANNALTGGETKNRMTNRVIQ